jgi:hypothetical protein
VESLIFPDTPILSVNKNNMSKTLCKTSDPEKRARKQEDPRFECKRCGKKAKKEKHLCKPQKN